MARQSRPGRVPWFFTIFWSLFVLVFDGALVYLAWNTLLTAWYLEVPGGTRSAIRI